jgi:hypothetical protein
MAVFCHHAPLKKRARFLGGEKGAGLRDAGLFLKIYMNIIF